MKTQKKILGLKLFVLSFCILILAAAAVAQISEQSYAEEIKEVWIKLWQKNGTVLDLRFQIRNAGADHRFPTDAVPLTTYPFEFDISELGNIPEARVNGIVQGSRIEPNGLPGPPLLLRWWVVRKNFTESGSRPANGYALTLKLRVFDADGSEFSPYSQQAALLEKDCRLMISKVN